MSTYFFSHYGWQRCIYVIVSMGLWSCATRKGGAAIFINELDADQTGTDTGEFIELYNSGVAAVALTNYALVLFDGGDDASYRTILLSAYTIAGGGYLVIGNATVPNASLPFMASNFLQNGQDAVALYSGVTVFANNTPAVSPPSGAVLLDAVVYDNGQLVDAALLAALTPGQSQINENLGGAGTTQAIARVPDGGISLNTSTYLAQVQTPGVSNSEAGGLPKLTLEVIPSIFVENGSTGTVTGTVARSGSTASALTVTLISANPAEATVPVSVVIAVGQTKQTFGVTAVDEAVSDGNKTFDLSASASGFSTVTQSITVLDNEPSLASLVVTLDPITITEGGAAATGKVERLALGSLPALTITLMSSNTAEAITNVASVTIPTGELSANFSVTAVEDAIYSPTVAIIITASASGFYDSAATVKVMDNDSPPFDLPTVVVNKYANTSPDLVELLVTGNGIPSTTVDMRRMVVKDFSNNMASDSGQGFRFADTAFFAAIKVGTLIVLTKNSVSSDVSQTAAGDFNLSLGLTDPTYFTAQTGVGNFAISTNEMIMIKRQDADFAGVVGSMHVLASGSAGAQFNLASGAKLISTIPSSSNNGVIALNSTSSLSDFNGIDATGNVPLLAVSFGLANDLVTGGPNFSYIRRLRGISHLNGLGFANSLVNLTPASPYYGVNIFPRGATGQVVAFTFTGPHSGHLNGLKITVPTAFGSVLTSGEVGLSGAGAGSPIVRISGQDITITGLASTETALVNIALSGLITPNPTALTDEPSYPFALQTSEAGTDFTAVGFSPSAAVLIPLSALRDVNAAGIPVDLGKIVAFEGICSEAQFSAGSDTTAYFQDGDFGFGLALSATPVTLVRGTRYALTGPFAQWNGLSLISLPGGGVANIINRGAATEVSPFTITVADLLAHPENYEGRLIKVLGLGTPIGSWNTSGAFTLKDASSSLALPIHIQVGSGATTVPASYPVNITGIFSQFDTAAPYTSGYQLLPREASDLEVITPTSGYSTWVAAFPGLGAAEEDSDGDGQSNFLEYALGTLPNNRSSVQDPDLTPVAGKPSYTITKGAAAASDATISYRVEGSSDLMEWTASSAEFDGNDGASSYTGRYLGSSPHYFFRLKIGPVSPP